MQIAEVFVCSVEKIFSRLILFEILMEVEDKCFDIEHCTAATATVVLPPPLCASISRDSPSFFGMKYDLIRETDDSVLALEHYCRR